MSSKATRTEDQLEAVPDALVGMDQAGVIRFVNHQTESLFGYDRDELVGRPIHVLVPEYLWEVYTEHRENYFADPRARSMGLDLELIGRQNDGILFPVNISLSHIDTGDVLLVITAARDVRRRKRALEQARCISAIVEGSNDAIVSMLLNGTLTSLNPSAEKLYGYSSEDIVGKSIDLLLPEARCEEVRASLVRIGAGQAVDRLETVCLRRDGAEFTISLTLSPVRDSDQAIVGASIFGRITANQPEAFTASRTVRPSSSSVGKGIIPGPDGRITRRNRSGGRVYGHAGKSVLGRPAGSTP